MNDNCPQCGEKYNEPQPEDFICGNCAFLNVLKSLAQDCETSSKMIVIQEKKDDSSDSS